MSGYFRNRHSTCFGIIACQSCEEEFMVVRKLRKEHNWSQDQLAKLSGLSIRTIQRVESGQSASLETLKCLASVFEVEIATLTEEITMIDKASEKWKEQPLWFRASVFGIRSRQAEVWFELGFLVVGIALLLVDSSVFREFVTLDFERVNRYAAPTFILGAYITRRIVHYGDYKQLW